MTYPADDITDAVPDRQGDIDLVQSDLAMNLFMVLMVVLAVLALSTAIVATVGFKAHLTSDPQARPEPPLGLARSWAPVLPISPRLVIRDGSVYRLDLNKLAAGFATNTPILQIMNNSKILSEDPDPAAYRVAFTLLSDPIPEEIIAWRASAKLFAPGKSAEATLPQSFRDDFDKFEQFDIFVYPDHEEIAWDVVALLAGAKKRYRIIFIGNGNLLQFERSSTRFTFEDMYK